ncbi:alanine--tRNA ligase, partial [Patescibacteria group bacterium]|nr:alanine--tRNA ligase [Patescibacteria group bacterium]
FDTEVFSVIFDSLREFSGKSYGTDPVTDRSMRIIADHIRAATFVIGDARGVAPSNVGQGYIVRRLLRRTIREGRKLGITDSFLVKLASVVIGEFGTFYEELESNRERIISETAKEEEKFAKTLEKGTKELEKMIEKGSVSGEQAFTLFSTYGFPLELTEEMMREQGATVDTAAFSAEFKKHQDLSRTASAGVFKGGLADHSEETTRLHTATHLLHQALRTVLGDHVGQKGSNITAERLRFDFSHGEKMTPEQITEVEGIVNDAINRDLPIHAEELTTEEAKARGAIGLFEDKYAQMGGKIKVYFVGNDEKGYFSKEICGGPHVAHTGELGSFKIQKEEAVSAGVRRIKATVGANASV